MKFSDLLNGTYINTSFDFDVAGIAIDSRKVKENFIFFALHGENEDGAKYIQDAIDKGAKAIFADEEVKINAPKVFFNFENTLEKFGIIAGNFYTKIPENLLAVTGTNGKTSVANFAAQLLASQGNKSAAIGTLGTLLDGDYSQKFSYSGLTSPDLITLLEDLTELKHNHVNIVAMEASSHGLVQKRMGNLRFKASAFTNFTQDHLDYHKTMDEYFAAKMLLFFEYTQKGGAAVLNADIEEFEITKAVCGKNELRIISYGKNGDDIKLNEIIPHDNGLDIKATIFGNPYEIETPLIGSFQAYNVACAIGLVIGAGYNVERTVAAAAKLKPVRGRMDIIRSPKQKAKIVIDYAHTPDALEKAIDSLRVHTSGRLITLFGCGGDRDKSKRPLMGRVAAEKSDVVIVTDDNPRSEVPAQIRKEIMASAPKAIEIEGRLDAIRKAVKMLEPGDSLLLAGKGHEDYQIIGKDKLSFDEFKIVNDALAGI